MNLGSEPYNLGGGGVREAPLPRCILAAILAALLLASTVCGFPSAAHADNTVELVLSQGVESVNEPFAVSGMLPGDCESIDIIVEVRHMEALSVAFEAEVAGEPVALSDALELRVVDRVEGTVLYEGTIAALDAHPLSVDLPKSEGGLSTLAWRVEVELPASAGNEHQASRCEVDLHWSVEEGDLAKLVPLVQTGDLTVLALLLVLACAAVGMMIAWWVRARQVVVEGAPATGKGRRAKASALLGAVFALLAAAALAWAAFGPHVRLPRSTFETGTVAIDLNGGEPVFPAGEVVLAPGCSVTREFTISNRGTADAYYRLCLADAGGGLAPALEVVIAHGDDVLFEGGFSGLASKDACVSDEVLAAGQTDSLTATVRMREGAGNAYQAADVSFDLRVQAVQARNNEGRGF